MRPSHPIPSHPILSHFIPSHSIRSYSIKLPKLIMCYIFGVLLPYSNIFRYVCKCESCVSCESSESSVSSVSSVNSLCGGVRDVPLYRLCIFFYIVQNAFGPHTPSFWRVLLDFLTDWEALCTAGSKIGQNKAYIWQNYVKYNI